MPNYHYVCPSCGTEEDVLKKIEDIDTSEECPRCRKLMHREIEAPAIHWRNTPKFHP